MNDTDLDLILAIADDRLTGQEKQDALERIAADPELGEELAAQIATIHELKSLDPAIMTPTERATLRANLVEQLHLSPATPVVAARPQRRRWWQPALGLASAAALLIAIVAVPSMLSGSDDSSADVVAIAPVDTTSVAATELDSASADSPSESGNSSPTPTVLVPQVAAESVRDSFAVSPLSASIDEAGNDDADDSGSGKETDDVNAGTTEVLTDSVSASIDEAGNDDADDSGSDEETDDVNAGTTEVLTDSVSRFTAEYSVPVDLGDLEACLETLSSDIPDGQQIPWVATLSDDATVIHFGVETDEGITYSVSIDIDTCSVVPLTP